MTVYGWGVGLGVGVGDGVGEGVGVGLGEGVGEGDGVGPMIMIEPSTADGAYALSSPSMNSNSLGVPICPQTNAVLWRVMLLTLLN